MELHELIRMTTLINRLAKRALFAEEQIVALEGQCAEWKRIADELKAERNARACLIAVSERVIKERDGLMVQVQDQRAEIERLRNDERKAYQDGEALRAEVADLRGIFDMVHASLGIKRGDHIGEAIEAMKSQRTPTTKQHPVKVGGWVRKTTDGLMYKIGDTFRLESYEIKDGQIWCNLDNGASWLMSVCEPCDPPEASHDTPAGKEAAEAASKVPQ